MKPTRFLIVAIVLLGLVATINAAGTPAGSTISNQAQGSYDDANGNEIAGDNTSYVFSNTVSTTVTQVAGASLGSDQAQNVSSLSSLVYSVLFTNTGNGSDTFALSAGDAGGQTGTYTYEIYSDLNDDGVINTGTNGTDAIVTSTGALAADSTYGLLIKVTDTTVGGAPEGDIIAVTLTALSGFDGGVNDAAVLTTTVQAATVTASITVDAPTTTIPGDVITYAICITNNGSAIAYDVVFTSAIPTNTTYSAGSIREGTTGWALGSLLTDGGGDDDGDFNITSSDTITVSLGNLAGSGGNVCVYYKVVVGDVGEGTPITNNPDINFDNGGGTPYPTVDPSGDGDITINIAESFGVDIASTGTTVFTGDPSDTLFYAFTVENLGNGTDNFDLTDASDYVVWTYYLDADDDGSLSTAELAVGALVGNNTGDLTKNEVGNYVAVGVIPAGTADEATDATTFTATSVGDGTETDTDTASATCTAPELTLTKTVTHSGSGSSVTYGTGDSNSAVPGTVLKYTIIVANGGTGVASTVVVSDAIPTNTTYVTGSMIIDADDTITDGSDADGGTLSGTVTTGSIVFDFGTLAASASHTLSFEVTIN